MANRINGDYLMFPYFGAKGGEVIISEISNLLHSQDIQLYLEPFAGSAKVFCYMLRDWPERFVANINDKQQLISNLWKCTVSTDEQVKREFIELISISLHSQDMHRISFEILKPYLKGEIFLSPISPSAPVAWAIWYSLCASFMSQPGNIYSIRKKAILDSAQPEAVKFQTYRKAMIRQIGNIKDCQVFGIDAIDFLRKFNTGDPLGKMTYIDPPYIGNVLGNSKGKVDQGWYSGYTEKDYTDLLDFLKNEYVGNFILSNYPSKMLDRYTVEAGWFVKDIPITCAASNQGNKKIERLVWNFDREKGQRKLF